MIHIETATQICSVALSEGDKVIGVKESHEERSHAAQLTPFMKEVVLESGKKFSDLAAVCVSIGPGSYTGLRIGISTAKGLAFGLDIPVIAVDTLESLSRVALPSILTDQPDNQLPLLLCPMLDARRMEVYTALYRPDLSLFREVEAQIIQEDSFGALLEDYRIVFFGNGSDKCRDLIRHPNARFVSGINPSAAGMIPPALQSFKDKKFEDSAYFEPRYLKDFLATTPKKKLF